MRGVGDETALPFPEDLIVVGSPRPFKYGSLVVLCHEIDAVLPGHREREDLDSPRRVAACESLSEDRVLVDELQQVVEPLEGRVKVLEANHFSEARVFDVDWLIL